MLVTDCKQDPVMEDMVLNKDDSIFLKRTENIS